MGLYRVVRAEQQSGGPRKRQRAFDNPRKTCVTQLEVQPPELVQRPMRKQIRPVFRNTILNTPRQRRHGTAGVGDDEVDIGVVREHTVPQQAQHGAIHVVVELRHVVGYSRGIQTAMRSCVRVQEHCRSTPIEFFEDRHLRGVARPHLCGTRVHRDAVRVERVERVLDLAQTAVRVGQRHGRKEPESTGMILPQRGGELVGASRQVARLGGTFVQRLGKRRAGYDRGGNSVPVHVAKSDLGRPGPRGAIQEGRQIVMVDIDTPGVIDGRLREQMSRRPQRRSQRQTRPRCVPQKLPAIHDSPRYCVEAALPADDSPCVPRRPRVHSAQG